MASVKESVDVIDMIIFIKQRVNDLTDNERKEIYQIIDSSNICVTMIPTVTCWKETIIF